MLGVIFNHRNLQQKNLHARSTANFITPLLLVIMLKRMWFLFIIDTDKLCKIYVFNLRYLEYDCIKKDNLN